MVSIIVPIYNLEQYLDRCIKSLISQNCEVEIILVDDGSTDSSAEICDEYAALDSRIKVIHIKNTGVSNARNVGLSLAKGEYITFVDGDDWLSDDFLEIGIKYLEATGADIFMGSYIKNYADGTEIKVNEDTAAMMLNYEECLENFFIQSSNKTKLSWIVCGKIFNAYLWKEVRFNIELSMGEDAVAFWDVLKKANKLLYMPIMGYHYFQRVDSAMHTYSVKHILDNLKMYKYFCDDALNCCSKLKQNYFKQRYRLREVETILEMSLQKNSNTQIEQAKKKLYTNISSYFLSAWNVHGIYGVIKIFIVFMPKVIIRVIWHVYGMIRCFRSMLVNMLSFEF